MSKIVVLSSVYLDVPSANGICARNIVEALRNNHNEVDVICYQADTLRDENRQDCIHMIPQPVTIDTHGFFGKIIRTVKVLFGSSKPIINQAVVANYLKRLDEINQDGKIDAVIAMFFPFESVEAMILFAKQNKHVHTFVFELDSISDGVSGTVTQGIYKKAYSRWLRRIYTNVNNIIIMKSHEQYWKSTFGKEFQSKFIISDLPVLVPKNYSKDEHKIVKMIYAGILSKRYRSPSYLLSVLKELYKKMPFEFLFFSKGDCEEEISQVAMEISAIRQKGFVTPHELEKEISTADVLISIGNDYSNSVPSKLITYFGYRKPIIHFSSQNKDVCEQYLQRYPLSTIIKQDKTIEEASTIIEQFLKRVRHETIEYSIIENAFRQNTPAYSSKIICDNIKTD